MRKLLKWLLLLGGIFILLAWTVAYFSRPYLTQFILQKASAVIGTPVEVAHAELDLLQGAIVIHQLKIGDGIRVKKIAVRFSPKSLLLERKTDLTLSFMEPVVHYPIQFPKLGGSAKGPKPLAINFSTIRIDEGVVYYRDQSAGKTFTLSNLNAKIGNLSHVNLRATLNNQTALQIVGSGNWFAAKKSFKAQANVKNLPLLALTSYYNDPKAAFQITGGTANLSAKLDCQKNQLHAPVHAVIQNLQIEPKKKLPLGFSSEKVLAEIKDASGNLELDFLISGDLNHLQFQLLTDLHQALGKALAKTLVQELPATIEKVKTLEKDIRSTIESVKQGDIKKTVEEGVEKLKDIFGQ